MRLPRFEYSAPKTMDKVLDLLSRYGDDAKILAGGTDLLVRMKKGLLKPKIIISLKNLKELSYIKDQGESIKIGAGTFLADIISSEVIQKHAFGLAEACEKIGAITIQHYRGTIGGNILQDNRCIHYNQSEFHRSGRQPCHKDGGKICYARDASDRCNSTCQSDGAAMLMAMDAGLVLAGKNGERQVKIADFYTTDGIMPFAMDTNELLKEIIIPVKGGGVSAYERLAYRSAVDYPIVCAAVVLKADKDKKDEISQARIVVGAMGRSPLFLAKTSSSLKGKKFDDANAFKQAGKSSMDTASTFAVHNVGSTLEYRCAMVAAMVSRALEKAGKKIIAQKG